MKNVKFEMKVQVNQFLNAILSVHPARQVKYERDELSDSFEEDERPISFPGMNYLHFEVVANSDCSHQASVNLSALASVTDGRGIKLDQYSDDSVLISDFIKFTSKIKSIISEYDLIQANLVDEYEKVMLNKSQLSAIYYPDYQIRDSIIAFKEQVLSESLELLLQLDGVSDYGRNANSFKTDFKAIFNEVAISESCRSYDLVKSDSKRL